jgi:hypothetical protein
MLSTHQTGGEVSYPYCLVAKDEAGESLAGVPSAVSIVRRGISHIRQGASGTDQPSSCLCGR